MRPLKKVVISCFFICGLENDLLIGVDRLIVINTGLTVKSIRLHFCWTFFGEKTALSSEFVISFNLFPPSYD